MLGYRIVFVAEARHAADGGQGGVQGKDHQECLAHAQSCLHLSRPAMFPVQSAAVYLAACVNPQMQPLASVIILSDGVYRHVLFIKCFFFVADRLHVLHVPESEMNEPAAEPENELEPDSEVMKCGIGSGINYREIMSSNPSISSLRDSMKNVVEVQQPGVAGPGESGQGAAEQTGQPGGSVGVGRAHPAAVPSNGEPKPSLRLLPGQMVRLPSGKLARVELAPRPATSQQRTTTAVQPKPTELQAASSLCQSSQRAVLPSQAEPQIRLPPPPGRLHIVKPSASSDQAKSEQPQSAAQASLPSLQNVVRLSDQTIQV